MTAQPFLKTLTIRDAQDVERVITILERDYSVTLTEAGQREAFRWMRSGGSPRQAAELIRSDINKSEFIQSF